jgi:hypothetical protein
MGIFNYIDTFFFISLGITFILILLLVFHFKQQIVSLEHKNDTMFEIINNIVKEITYVKSAIFSQPYYHVNDQDEIINLSANEIHSKQNIEKKIVVSDDDNDSEDDYDGDDDSDIDSDEDEDDGHEHSDSEDECDSDDSEHANDDNQDNLPKQDSVKVINIELGDSIDNIEELADNEYDDDHEPDTETNTIEEINTNTIEEKDNIIVEKLDIQDNHLDNNQVNEQGTQIENIKEVYRKMTLIQLKALVISKGLTSDSSKMRKPELLKLLESNIDENN